MCSRLTIVSKRFGFIGLAAAMFLVPTRSNAALITGSQLNITGDGTVGATFLNWSCNAPGDPTVCPAGSGDFGVAGSTLTFAQYNGTFGLVKSLNNSAQPLNTPFLLTNFVTFDLNSNEAIDLTFIPLGTDTGSTTCAGLTHCTPMLAALITPNNPQGLSSFNLDQNGTGTAATFGVMGTIRDSSGSSAPISGIYTAQFSGQTPSGVLALFAAAGANGLNSTYSAQFSFTTVPEPVSLSLVGIGLVGLGLVRRRIRRPLE